MSHTIYVGDTISHRGPYGTAPDALSRIAGIELRSAAGEDHQSVSAEDREGFFVHLEDGQCLDGFRIELVPHESVPPVLRRFANWFCDRHGIRSRYDLSFVCGVLAFELGLGDGQGRHDDSATIRADDSRRAAIVHRLTCAYHQTFKASEHEVSQEVQQHLETLVHEHQASHPAH